MSKSRRAIGDAFSRSFTGTGDIIADNLHADKKRQSELNKTKQEEGQKLIENQDKIRKELEANNIISQLLSGGKTYKSLPNDPATGGKDYVMPFTQKQKSDLMLKLSSSDINRYQDIVRSTEKPVDEYVERDYSNPKAIYGFNKRTNKVEKIQDGNPLYKPKRTNTATEYNASGEKIIREFYDDGTIKDIPTGFYKRHNSDGNGNNKDAFDLDKFNKTINSFNEEDIKINKLKAEYRTLPTDELKYEINAKNESNQATLYDLMDDDSKNIVNEWYTQLKKASEKAGKDYTELERTDQEKLKTKFIETISKNFDGSSEDYARKRALILYAKFKYGYVR